MHQLNAEVDHFRLAKWLSEGLASYFVASRLTGDRLAVGRIDAKAAAIWIGDWQQRG